MRIAKTVQTYTIILVLLFVFAASVQAATTVEVGIPGRVEAGGTINGIPEYIKYLYYFVLGLVGIAGFTSLVFWGAVWAGSGVIDKKAQAISGIKNTFTGIGIALTAFILLNTINPDLVVIKTPSISEINIPKKNEPSLANNFYKWIKIQNSDTPSCTLAVGNNWIGVKPEQCANAIGTCPQVLGVESCMEKNTIYLCCYLRKTTP